MAVHGAVRLDERDGGKRPVREIVEEVSNIAHVIGALRGVVGFVLEGVADGAVAVYRVVRDREIVAAAVVDPRDPLVVQFVSDGTHVGRGNVAGGISWRAVRIESLAM